KYRMSCCLLSSNKVKSPLSRFPTRPPRLSRTVKRTLTTSTSTLMVGASWATRKLETSNVLRTRIILIDASVPDNVPMRKAILHLKKADPVLGSVIDRVGAYRIQYRDPVFETIVRSIVYQQLSGKVAAVIFGRLAAMLPDGAITPESILKLTPARMRRAG